MIKRQLAKVPVEVGNRVAYAYIIAFIFFTIGWVARDWSAPLLCYYAA